MVSKICLIIDVNDDNKFMPAAIYQPPVKIYKQDTYMYILFITYLRFFLREFMQIQLVRLTDISGVLY